MTNEEVKKNFAIFLHAVGIRSTKPVDCNYTPLTKKRIQKILQRWM